MNAYLDQIYKTRSVQDQSGDSYDAFPTSIDYRSGQALYRLIRSAQPETTLEIGMAYGVSTLWICQAMRDNDKGHHTVIDRGQSTQWHDIGLRNVRNAGYGSMITVYDDFSYQILPKLFEQHTVYDIILIDGRHVFDETLVEFFLSDRVLRCNGFMVFHDLWLPSIRKVISYAVRNRAYRICDAYHVPESSFLKRCRYFLSDIRKTPLDLILGQFAWRRLTHGLADHCVLKRISEDTRPWTHYRTF